MQRKPKLYLKPSSILNPNPSHYPSCLYCSAIVVGYSGWLAPFSLLLVSITLKFYQVSLQLYPPRTCSNDHVYLLILWWSLCASSLKIETGYRGRASPISLWFHIPYPYHLISYIPIHTFHSANANYTAIVSVDPVTIFHLFSVVLCMYTVPLIV